MTVNGALTICAGAMAVVLAGVLLVVLVDRFCTWRKPDRGD